MTEKICASPICQAAGKPCKKAIEVAARVWCDQEMISVVMDTSAAMEIAKIIDGVLADQRKRPEDTLSKQELAEYLGISAQCTCPACYSRRTALAEKATQLVSAKLDELTEAGALRTICTCPASDMLADGWKCTCGASA